MESFAKIISKSIKYCCKVRCSQGSICVSTTAQKMKFSIKDFFSFLQISSHLLNKSLMENIIFCDVYYFHVALFFMLHSFHIAKNDLTLSTVNLFHFLKNFLNLFLPDVKYLADIWIMIFRMNELRKNIIVLKKCSC